MVGETDFPMAASLAIRPRNGFFLANARKHYKAEGSREKYSVYIKYATYYTCPGACTKNLHMVTNEKEKKKKKEEERKPSTYRGMSQAFSAPPAG